MTHFSDGLRVGDFFPNGLEPGVPLTPFFVYDVVPVALSATAVCAAQPLAAAGNLLINGASASGGVATLDVPRAVSVVSNNTGDTTQVATVFGFDVYGQPMSEAITFNGTTTVNGQKAFSRVTRVSASAALAGNASVGSTDILGLPYRMLTRGAIQTFWDTAFVTTGTFAAADTTSPATATTDDVRGTFLPPSATNGTRRLMVWMRLNPTSQLTAYGVTQA